MINFSDEIRGFISILRKIELNDKSKKLIHKEIRAYSRCLLAVYTNLSISESIKPEIKILLISLSASGLAQYDRAFLATRILKLLEDEELSLLDKEGEEGKDIF